MSRNADYLRAYFDRLLAISGNVEASLAAADTLLSNDFQLLDKDGNVQMDRASYRGFGSLLYASFKDLKYLYSDIHDEGGDVVVRAHWEGTFTGDLDLSAMGMGVVPASGKKIVWPESSSKWKVEGDKVVSIQDVSEGGIGEFLAPLGAKPPSG
jgi:hypothetical protein